MRYATASITEANWAAAALLTDALPGDTSIYTAAIPYAGGKTCFALKSWNEGGPSAPSNNAFWPALRVYLPVILRE